MKILVTGAAGFLGTRLALELLKGSPDLPAVSRLIAADLAACRIADPRADVRVGSVADDRFIRRIVDDDVDVVYHLAAVLSGQSEAEFDTGMRVNVDATRMLLERCRRLRTPPRFVFTSSIAVFGGDLPPVVRDDTSLTPQSSYGTAKAVAELLVAEYSRRGFVDGIACRLPTVAIRPGAPNSALSSFVSGIVREPLNGIDSVCPVPPDLRLWITSPDVLTRNLVHAGQLETFRLGSRRAINFPGLSVTPGEMLDSLERLAGAATRARVRVEPDERLMRVVGTWPGVFDVSRALGLGFAVDADVDSVIRQFMRERAVTS